MFFCLSAGGGGRRGLLIGDDDLQPVVCGCRRLERVGVRRRGRGGGELLLLLPEGCTRGGRGGGPGGGGGSRGRRQHGGGEGGCLALAAAARREARQTGQVECCLSQASMQATWKAWPQEGSTRTTSFASYSSRHTGHLRARQDYVSFTPPNSKLSRHQKPYCLAFSIKKRI